MKRGGGESACSCAGGPATERDGDLEYLAGVPRGWGAWAHTVTLGGEIGDGSEGHGPPMGERWEGLSLCREPSRPSVGWTVEWTPGHLADKAQTATAGKPVLPVSSPALLPTIWVKRG